MKRNLYLSHADYRALKMSIAQKALEARAEGMSELYLEALDAAAGIVASSADGALHYLDMQTELTKLRSKGSPLFGHRSATELADIRRAVGVVKSLCSTYVHSVYPEGS